MPFRICKLSLESLQTGLKNKELEKVHMRAIEVVITVKNLHYMGRLIRLNLPTLKYRRIRGDVTKVYKILTNRYDTKYITFNFPLVHPHFLTITILCRCCLRTLDVHH